MSFCWSSFSCTFWANSYGITYGVKNVAEKLATDTENQRLLLAESGRWLGDTLNDRLLPIADPRRIQTELQWNPM